MRLPVAMPMTMFAKRRLLSLILALLLSLLSFKKDALVSFTFHVER